MWLLLIPIFVLVVFALLINWRNKKMNNTHQKSMNPNAKPGESSNHTMGDNRYMNGG